MHVLEAEMLIGDHVRQRFSEPDMRRGLSILEEGRLVLTVFAFSYLISL